MHAIANCRIQTAASIDVDATESEVRRSIRMLQQLRKLKEGKAREALSGHSRGAGIDMLRKIKRRMASPRLQGPLKGRKHKANRIADTYVLWLHRRARSIRQVAVISSFKALGECGIHLSVTQHVPLRAIL